jgi:hypothetical protein
MTGRLSEESEENISTILDPPEKEETDESTSKSTSRTGGAK